MRISGNIITLNEERNIEDCIKSLQQVCDEIVVVDSGSTDSTVAIAESLGARVVVQSYLGDGFQKNVALSYVHSDWVLSIDADERLTPEMVSEIQALKLGVGGYDAYAFRRRNMVGSRWIKRCGWYPDYCIRLYNKNTARFASVKQHAKVEADHVKTIKADMIHYSFKNIGELFSKGGRNYPNRSAKIMYLKGKKVTGFAPFSHGFFAFFRAYILKGGFMLGVDGLSVSMSIGLNSYLKYARLLEYQRDAKVRNQEDFEKIW